MSYDWVLFDADGTLFDYEVAEREALEALWRDSRLEERSEDLDAAYRRINGALWRLFESGGITSDEIKEERFRQLAVELGLDADPARLSRDYISRLALQTQLLPDAERLLATLAPRYRLGLITNGLAEVQRSRLERSPIGDRFELVVISEEVGFAKPDPRIFAHAHDRMARPAKERVLMVGDNLVADIGGAQRFGLATCWINLGRRELDGDVEPTHEVHSLQALEASLA